MTTYREAPDDLRRAVRELVDENLARYRRVALISLACGVVFILLGIFDAMGPKRGRGVGYVVMGVAGVAGALLFMPLVRRRFDTNAVLRALLERPGDVSEILVVPQRDETGKPLEPLLEVRLAGGEKQAFQTKEAKRYALQFVEHCPNARLDEGPL